MARKGRTLELLMKCIETTLISQGIKITSPELFYDNEDKLIGEVDVTLRGKFGSMEILAGIECRDKPSKGAQGRDWIRELIGKQRDLGFNKMTAVSSTGFTSPAVKLAIESGIELIVPGEGEFIESTRVNELAYIMRIPHWNHGSVRLVLDHDDDEIINQAVNILNKSEFSVPFLLPGTSEIPCTIREFIQKDVDKIIEQSKIMDEQMHELSYEKPINAIFSGHVLKVSNLSITVHLWIEKYLPKFKQIGFMNIITNDLVAIAFLNEYRVKGRNLLMIWILSAKNIKTSLGKTIFQFKCSLLNETGYPFFPAGTVLNIEWNDLELTSSPISTNQILRLLGQG